jgi:hypothetical protein
LSGPPPKPAATRRRRNKAPAPVKLPSETPTRKTPTLPGAIRYSKATRDWWATVWASPMATIWLAADVPALVRLATLVELVNQGEATAMVLAEIRQLEDRFGLSPLARRRLQWEVEQAAGAEAKPVAAQEGRWLRAVCD